jgi:hypothetical protein
MNPCQPDPPSRTQRVPPLSLWDKGMLTPLAHRLPPQAYSCKHRLFWCFSRFRRRNSTVSDVLLQPFRGQITGFHQDLLVLLVQFFSKEFHFGTLLREQ